ncbi:condensation domain-containing protein [Actinoplanes sp. NPDC051851]|uniref:condensation domain-containing protein n=1 Tax=Actinoplanes sp. NPDC051851 TaxID=3154753 RepID=UPI00343AFDE0
MVPGGDALCYVIYTSGTTGRPKGVLAHHRGVVNYLSWACRAYGITAGSRVLLHSPLTFDLSVTTTLAPLIAGAVIEMTDGEDLDGLVAALRDTAEPYQLVKLTPAHLRVLNIALAEDLDRRVLTRCLIVGGESLPAERVRPWHRSRVINEYGPTETVVGCTVHEWTGGDIRGNVPIGRPIANATNYVLDRYRQPVPVGVPGELWVGGAGVTLGYLSRPDLTAERFAADPFHPGGRMYRTGDLAVWGADGLLRCLGRNDDQVKIRGYRVELGEVENTLRTLPGVLDTAVIHEPRHGTLVAYAVAPAADLTQMWSGLRNALPDFMVPSRIHLLEQLPLTINGKVDRAALLRDDPRFAHVAAGADSDGEKALLRLWADLLGRPDAGRHDDFFAAGGDSLALIDLHERLGGEVPLVDLFRNPTAAAMAALVDAASSPGGTVAVRPAATDPALAMALEVASAVLGGPLDPDTDFFILGGTSLDLAVICTRLAAALGHPIPISEAIRRPTARLLAEWAGDREPEPVGPAPADEVEADGAEVPLTPMQASFLMRQVMNPDDLSGHCPLICRVDGPLDPGALVTAFGDVIRRHAALGATYTFTADDQPVAVLDAATGDHDITLLPGSTDVASAVTAVASVLMRPLDIQNAPPWRAAVTPILDGTATVLGIVVHHVAFDGHSEGVLVEDLSRAYHARLHGAEPRYPVDVPTLAESARVLRDCTAGVDLDAQRSFWRDLLHAVPDLDLPVPGGARRSGGTRVGGHDGAAVTHTVEVDAETVRALSRIAQDHATTPFAVLLSAWAAALARVTGQQDFGVGVTVSRRAGAGLDRVVGCFVETLCLRTRPAAGADLATLLDSTLPGIRAAIAARDIPFTEVVRLVNPPRTGRDPLYQVLFVYQERPWAAVDFGGHSVRPLPFPPRQGVCELVVEMWPQPDGRVVVDLTYQTRAVTKECIHDLARELTEILRGA